MSMLEAQEVPTLLDLMVEVLRVLPTVPAEVEPPTSAQALRYPIEY